MINFLNRNRKFETFSKPLNRIKLHPLLTVLPCISNVLTWFGATYCPLVPLVYLRALLINCCMVTFTDLIACGHFYQFKRSFRKILTALSSQQWLFFLYQSHKVHAESESVVLYLFYGSGTSFKTGYAWPNNRTQIDRLKYRKKHVGKLSAQP